MCDVVKAHTMPEEDIFVMFKDKLKALQDLL